MYETSKPAENCCEFIGGKLTIAGKQKSQQIEKTLWGMAVLQFILYIALEGGSIWRARRNSLVVD